MATHTYTNSRISLRRLLPVLLLLLLMVALAACQSSNTPAAEEATTEAPAAGEAAVEATEAPAGEPAAEEAAAEATVIEEPTDEAPAEDATAEEASVESDAAATGLQSFVIVPDDSQARFYIDEVLMGQDKTVEGVTSDVSGEIRLDPANPSASEIGPITINARDFTTDADRRNGAIRRFVLQSDQDAYQYITFTPTAIEGMPDSVSVGEPFSFQVTGDLQIRDTVNSETFDVTVTPVSESELTGLAETTVLRSDYGLTIPQVPSVTGVVEEVILQLEFTAAAQ